MWNIFRVLAFTLGTVTCLHLGSEDSKGWLRVCQQDSGQNSPETGQHYEIDGESCPHGAWLTDSISNSCICLNGVWAISESWCDEDYYIVYGSGDCFQLDIQIKKLTYLGSKKDAFEPINFITKGNGHVFHSFSNDFTMPFDPSSNHNNTIIRLRPKKETGLRMGLLQDLTWEEENILGKLSMSTMFGSHDQNLCVDTDFHSEWQDGGLTIYKINKGIRSLEAVNVCPTPTHTLRETDKLDMQETISAQTIRSGEAIHVKSGRIIKASQFCSALCKTRALSEDLRQQKLIRHKRDSSDLLQLEREFSVEDKDEMVRTSNLRVVKQELGWLLHANRPPVLKAPNWKLARKAKEVFVKVCPEKETPRFLVNAMMRLFRLYYMNSREFYPTTTKEDEKAQNDRILATLDTCLKDATEIKFAYNMTVEKSGDTKERKEDDGCREEKQGNTTIKFCKCKESLGNLNVTYSLSSTGPGFRSYSVEDRDLALPEGLRFLLPSNSSQRPGETSKVHDVPTETFWKIISFAHFYCAKYFSENPGDLSAFIVKLTDFFNEDITYRWFKPGSASFKTWQFMYNSFDIQKFAKSVDACLAVSKKLSIFPDWLNRPTGENTRRKKRSVDSVKLWEGVAYCLNDPWDPIVKLGASSNDERCAEYNVS